MFQVGDKIICINDVGVDLTIGRVYTIDKVISYSTIKMLFINHFAYNSKNFITIEEGRRLKLDKICSKLVIK